MSFVLRLLQGRTITGLGERFPEFKNQVRPLSVDIDTMVPECRENGETQSIMAKAKPASMGLNSSSSYERTDVHNKKEVFVDGSRTFSSL